MYYVSCDKTRPPLPGAFTPQNPFDLDVPCSGFYGMGCLREMGLRRSKHVGDWRTHSTFKNKEEEFRQPLKGLDTVLEKGLTIRSSGGIRKPGSAVGETESEFDEPQKGRATIRQNISIIRLPSFLSLSLLPLSLLIFLPVFDKDTPQCTPSRHSIPAPDALACPPLFQRVQQTAENPVLVP
jgi:hypothetical protein